MKQFKVSDSHVKTRLDVYVAQKLPEVSRSFIKKLCDTHNIEVNGNTEPASYRLKPGDKVKINYDLEQPKNIPLIDIPIIYEDEDCIVIDKPVGILVHSKGNFNPEATVATWLQPKLIGLEGNRAGIVHRLDRATSGVMICAKNPETLTWLQKQFSTRKVKKLYVAIIEGHLQPAAAIIDMPIERHPTMPKLFRVGENGRKAITEYKTVKTNGKLSELELKPQTGRTHQLRVHLKQLGHPIYGDILYGGHHADRLYLHAKSLELSLPNRERRVFVANLPKEFNELMS